MIDIRDRWFSPRDSDGLKFVPSLRKFTILYNILGTGIRTPPVRVVIKSNGAPSVVPADKALLSAIESRGDALVIVERVQIPSPIISCNTVKVAIQHARKGYVARVYGVSNVETFKLVEGMVEREIISKSKKGVHTLVEYII